MDRSGSDSSGDDVFNEVMAVMQPPAPPTLLLTTTGSLFKTPPTILKTAPASVTAGRRFSYWRRLYANQVRSKFCALGNLILGILHLALIKTFQAVLNLVSKVRGRVPTECLLCGGNRIENVILIYCDGFVFLKFRDYFVWEREFVSQ